MSNEPASLLVTEPDRPNVPLITLFIIGTTSVVLALIIGLMQYFHFAIRAEIEKKQYASESTSLRKLRADEHTKLGNYSWVSQKDGTVRMPIDRAIELTLRDWNRRPAGLAAFEPAGPPPADPHAVAPHAAAADPHAAPAATDPHAAAADPHAAPADPHPASAAPSH